MKLKNANILVVDDDQDLLTAVGLLLKPKVNRVIKERNPDYIPTILSKEEIHLILLDMNFKSAVNTGNEGLFWLQKIKSMRPDLPVVMITAYGAIDLAVESLKRGARDFIVKPWQNDRLESTLGDALQQQGPQAKAKSIDQPDLPELIGESDIMKSLQVKISKIAPTDANILILGENGTGKDIIASRIHHLSLRNRKPLVKVDVGALTDTLFESELFGHKKGAFTDARDDRKGRFEAADGGTLFLDEIGNISLQHQAKLLSVLQNRQVVPLGSNTPVPVDIRLLCATNVPMSVLADETRFRKDLVYRINTVEVQVPPLRERGNDCLQLARHFLAIYARKYNKSFDSFDPGALQKLRSYHYPGNVRELQYCIERAVIMAEGDGIMASDIIFSPIETAEFIPAGVPGAGNNLMDLERATIKNVVDKHNGNISKAARELGITRTALYRRLNKYDI
ncbi:sigma-54 dependent transcriptional regulator [Ravibacter arvi]|uniref:Sigma-54 dependent transcriptional regulator n=1 Tax=Ravibacter arvi TaxID=2051041 RepID=A0ABP8M8U1_9BACT